MDKIWLKQYPAGVPAEIDINTYKSVKDIFETCSAKFGPRPAFSNMGVSMNRFSMLVDNCVVTKINDEGPGTFEFSDADTMLKAL